MTYFVGGPAFGIYLRARKQNICAMNGEVNYLQCRSELLRHKDKDTICLALASGSTEVPPLAPVTLMKSGRNAVAGTARSPTHTLCKIPISA